MKKIQKALISVYNKSKILPIASFLNKMGVTIISTGGTQNFLEQHNIAVRAVEDITEYPSILGGRVKTLHPKIFGGILGRSNNSADKSDLKQFSICSIDMVIIDLYPFQERPLRRERPLPLHRLPESAGFFCIVFGVPCI